MVGRHVLVVDIGVRVPVGQQNKEVNTRHMTHPFVKMFTTALKESTPMDNLVLKEAERLKAKGYRPEEIHVVLLKLHKGRIDDEEREVLQEAVEEFESYL